MKTRLQTRNNNFILIIITFISLYGVVISLGLKSYDTVNELRKFLTLSVLKISLGFIVVFIIKNFDYRNYLKYSLAFFVISAFLSILAKVEGFSVSNRYLIIGAVQINPGILLLFSTILLICYIFSKTFSVIKIVIVCMVACGIFMMIPYMSMAIVLVAIVCCFLIMTKPNYFATFFISMATTMVLLIFSVPYRLQRIQEFINPFLDPQGSGWETVNSIYSIAAGGIFGMGFGATDVSNSIPTFGSTYILSGIALQFGIIGVVLLFLLYTVFILEIIKIAKNAVDESVFFIVAIIGIKFMVSILLQTSIAVNMLPAMSLDFMPFIEESSSNYLMDMLLVGILLNISKQNSFIVAGENING